MSDACPGDWKPTTLGAVVTVESGIGFPHEHQGEATGDFPFYKVSDVSNAVLRTGGKLKAANHYVSVQVADGLRGKPVKAGATVFAKIGEAIRLNRRAFVEVPGLIDNNVMSVKAHVDEMDRYVYYFLRTVDFGKQSRATTVPSLRKGDVEDLELPVAPLNEQRRIADKLDTVLARVDAVNDRLARVAPLLKRFRQSVLAAATSGKLTEEWRRAISGETEQGFIALGQASWPIPATWTTWKLDELIDPKRPLCYGVVQPGDAPSDGIPLIRVQDLDRASVLVGSLRTISAEIDDEFRRSRVKPGDVLVSVVGTIGRVAIVPDGFEGNIARAIARVACQANLRPKWLGYWLESPEVQWWLTSSSKEVARKTLNLGDLAVLPIPLPSSAEQAEIIRRVELLFGYADRLEVRLKAAQAAADRLTPALLAKAFRGELVPQDPNDEPASELLRRLAESRAASSVPRKRGRPARSDA